MVAPSRKSISIVTIKKLCDGLDITLGKFFSTKEFDGLEQEIKQSEGTQMNTRSAVAQRLLLLCEERNLAVNALARSAAVPPSTLKNIINGVSKNPGVVTIKKLCDGLDITLGEFFSTKEFDELEQEIK